MGKGVVTSGGGDSRIDVMPMLIVGLVIIVLFVLIRPPFLLLFGTEAPKDEGFTIPDDSPYPSRVPHKGTHKGTAKPIAKPIPAPPLPDSLAKAGQVAPPPRWVDTIPLDPDAAKMSEHIRGLTNQERSAVGLGILEHEPTLAAVAVRHSKDMLDNAYLAHTSKDGDGPAQRTGFLHRRLFGLVGENVALFDSQAVAPEAGAQQFMQQWMNSLGHRRNILSETYDRLGVGCYRQQDAASGQVGRRCTQLFAQAFAHATADIPEQVASGSSLPIEVLSRPGVLPATAIAQVDLSTGRELSRAPLSVGNDGVAAGELPIVGTPGIYGLQLHIPKDQQATVFSLVPGPYIVVE